MVETRHSEFVEIVFMKIMLFGSEGMLGYYIQDLLQSHEVVAFSHRDVDITDFDTVNKLIASDLPQIVINATAYNDVENSETPEGFKEAKLVNGEAVGNLAKATHKINGIFISFSTEYVFDGEKNDGYKENDYTSPINNYGRSKLLGEQLIQRVTNKFYIIRMSRLFGNSGRSIHSKKSFVDLMLDIAKEKNNVLLVNDEISSPTYAHDAVKSIENILRKNLPFGIYHITNSGQCSWHEFAVEAFYLYKKIAPKFKIPDIKQVSSDEFKRKAVRPKFSVLLNTKLPPLRNWKLALGDYIKTKG